MDYILFYFNRNFVLLSSVHLQASHWISCLSNDEFIFLSRDHHPGNVFSSMENIMTLVLEESEDIPPEMLSPILHYVRKDDEVIH